MVSESRAPHQSPGSIGIISIKSISTSNSLKSQQDKPLSLSQWKATRKTGFSDPSQPGQTVAVSLCIVKGWEGAGAASHGGVLDTPQTKRPFSRYLEEKENKTPKPSNKTAAEFQEPCPALAAKGCLEVSSPSSSRVPPGAGRGSWGCAASTPCPRGPWGHR